ncbi:hypothetical protein [Fibrobacter sp.]|uniref:hypothetical protein n=1 Tax=Fibrobacter sp. TaxID=35828 RepID=UPI0026036A23|nr:hypothetical protein [Fibrobacter sp.]MDD5943456.1 hypothetical protein [Fibrobacter sp.]
MNKKVKFALIGTALVLGACADYSVDSDDMAVKTSNAGNGVHDVTFYKMPSDFDLDTYLSLNPDVKYFQIIDRLRNQDNKPRLDSMANNDTKAEATALYNADNEAFLADEALVKKAFLMAGYPESMWEGAAELNKEQKAIVLRFNKQQIGGAPSAAEDVAYLDNFVYDPDLYEMHYAAFGILDGRAYRACAAADITIPAGNPQAGKTVVSKAASIEKQVATIVNLADTLGAKPRIMDYSSYYFCQNAADGQIYPIWNDEGGERLVRIREVQDSLLVANPPEPEPTEPAAEENPAAAETASEETAAPAAEEPSTEEPAAEESGVTPAN